MRACLLPVLLLACHPEEKPADDRSSDTDPPINTVPAPCADGTWMGASSPDGLVFARASDELGDGTYLHPYGDVRRAALAVASLGSGTLAVYPGDYASVVIRAPAGGSVALTGCGSETRFGVGLEGGRRAGVALEGPGTVTARRFSVEGGSPGVAVRAGAVGTVEDVVIDAAARVGLQVAGPGTVATVKRVTVGSILATGSTGPRGWGVSLADGSLDLRDSAIAAQGAYGLYAERGHLTVTNVTIAGDANGPVVGGLYAHAMAEVSLDGVQVRQANGEGIHLYEVAAATLHACTVDTVGPSRVRGDTRQRGQGDGIVVRAGGRRVSTAVLDGNTVTGATRLGIAVAGGAVTLSGNTTTGNGVEDDGASTWATTDTVVTGTASALDPATYPLGRDEHPGQGPVDFERPGMP